MAASIRANSLRSANPLRALANARRFFAANTQPRVSSQRLFSLGMLDPLVRIINP